jgi:hypothetical protein
MIRALIRLVPILLVVSGALPNALQNGALPEVRQGKREYFDTRTSQHCLKTGMQKPRLILYFDVNKTIIASDAVQGKGTEETLNALLAESMEAAWDGVKKQSYYAYLTDQILRENPSFSRTSQPLKDERSTRLKQFPAYLATHHPDLFARYTADKYKMVRVVQHSKQGLFPSFLALIAWLEKEYAGNYRIHLRTFGQDLPDVIHLIEAYSPVRFSARAGFQGATLHIYAHKRSNDTIAVGTPVDTLRGIYDLLSQASLHNYAIQDDFNYWKAHNYSARGAKLFLIDPQDTRVIALFFDDNAADNDRVIINPVSLEGTPLERDLLIRTGKIIPVDTKEALLDQHYFIQKVQKAVDAWCTR